MTDYKTIRFNKILYPYLELSVYDYDLNRDVQIKVGSIDLENALMASLLSGDKTQVNNASNFDPDFKRFIPRKMFTNNTVEEIQQWIKDNPTPVI